VNVTGLHNLRPRREISSLGTEVYRQRGQNASRSGEPTGEGVEEHVSAGVRSVLIVDDNADVVRTFARMLRSSGYEVLTAVDSESALRRLAADHPDAALVDLRLPVVDGMGFMRRLRAQEGRRRTPVALVTGDLLLDDAVLGELRALNATVYFKPLWAHDLMGLTEFLLRGDNLTESQFRMRR